MHRLGVANLDANGLNQNRCTSQEDDTGARWHGEVDEEMVLGWHASAFLCLLGVDFRLVGHMTFYCSQRIDGQFSDPEVEDGSTGHHDVHDDTLMLEFLWTSMVPNMVNAKRKTVFSNELRCIGWRGHIYSECGRMVRCGLYHI